ncbi:MAG: sulfite exporter TauE/SafE family protein [Chloroflexi bacterium]|nr:sulfite exporter TauE/SafE family protein [Chloroflexota bacterium]
MATAFLLGLLGSLGHCVGMCSAVIILLDRQPSFHHKSAWILSHAGRITTYMILGGIAGALGQSLFSLKLHQAILSILFSVFAFYFALAFAGLAPSPELLFSGLIKRWGIAMRGQRPASFLTPYLLGLLWGLLPCGLVLTALLTAAASVNIFQGASIMFAFGIATIPSLFAVKWLGGQIVARAWSRSLVSLTMMLFGFQFAMRGFASLGWVGHFMLGNVMFW